VINKRDEKQKNIHKNHNGEKVFLPRVECIIGKNKITEIKKSFFLD
jgi:hypothetical protein